MVCGNFTMATQIAAANLEATPPEKGLYIQEWNYDCAHQSDVLYFPVKKACSIFMRIMYALYAVSRPVSRNYTVDCKSCNKQAEQWKP